MYSLISILIKFSSDSNISEAKTLANWVFPTPVCPRKINEPIGLLGEFKPALFLWIDLTTLETAWSCPIILSLIIFSSFDNLFFSVDTILLTGMLVIIETTSAISFSSTVTLFSFESSCHLFWASTSFFSTLFSSSRSLAASSYFCFFTTEFFNSLTSSSCFSIRMTSSGTSILFIWALDPASSRASIALSGRNLSVIYLWLSSTQAINASSV